MYEKIFKWMEENIELLKKIRTRNEIGDCNEVMQDLIIELKDTFNVKRLVIYAGKERGFIEHEYIYTAMMPEFSTIERGSINRDYVIHWLPLIEHSYVIDLNYPENISISEDMLFELSDYKHMLKSLNKDIDLNYFYK